MIEDSRRAPASGAHLVVVNDDPLQLRTMRAILESAGYRVTPFESPARALRTLQKGPEVDLFVVDLHMPEIDGWKVCRLLRSPEYARYNAVPILVVSAIFTGTEVESITSELGASSFLEIPYRRPELLAFVEALLEGRQPEVESVAMVVEDDASVRSVVTRAFENEGYRVLQAATVDQARSLARDHRLKVVVLDYHLPDGNCEDLLAEVCRPLESRVTLVMTGDGDPELPLRLVERGIDGYVRKPFEPRFLVELAERAGRQRALLRVEAALESRTRELSESEHRYRVLVETIPDALLVLDADNRIHTVNPAGAQRLGSDPSHLVGRTVAELAPPEAVAELDAGVALLRRGARHGFQTQLRDASGTSFPVEVAGRPLRNGSQDKLLLVARDITERRRVEDERRRLEKRVQSGQRLESLGVLAGGVAHDFNNLLVGILGNAALARMDLPHDSPGLEFLEQIELAARSAAELTEQIMTFAGKRKVKSEDLSLAELVREMEQVLRPVVSRKARVRYDLSGDLPRIRGDAGQLRQVAMNLIINASDALEGAPGDIRVRTRAIQVGSQGREDLVGGRKLAPGRYVALEVSDDGCGMDAATAQRIFEPFFTTKISGRGLGLAATLGIARAHGGGIAVDSEPGRGTTISVFLPANGVEADSEVAEEETPPWRGGGTVLVADDEPAVRRLAATTLRRAGFQVTEAVDGRDALERIEAMRKELSLVVLDVTMPEVDGLEVLASVRRDEPHLPVLLSSGYSAEVIDEPGPGEPTGFLPKPYGPGELMAAVSRLLRDGGGGDPALVEGGDAPSWGGATTGS